LARLQVALQVVSSPFYAQFSFSFSGGADIIAYTERTARSEPNAAAQQLRPTHL
jgi:hypothetical protein